MTIWNTNAATFATIDREAHADMLLDLALVEAAALIRIAIDEGSEWARLEAVRVIAKAQRRAGRILPAAPALAVVK